MTRAPDDQPPMWLKQVPMTLNSKPAVWTQSVLANHRPIARSATRPRDTVDGVTLSRLLLALDNLHPQGRDLPADTALLEVMRSYDAYRHFEKDGKDL